jgi:hypothetical protein
MKNSGHLIFFFFILSILSSSTKKKECLLINPIACFTPSQTYLSNNTKPENHSSTFTFSTFFTSEADEDKDEKEKVIGQTDMASHFNHIYIFFEKIQVKFLTHSAELSRAFVNQVFSPPEFNC